MNAGRSVRCGALNNALRAKGIIMINDLPTPDVFPLPLLLPINIMGVRSKRSKAEKPT